MREKNTDILKTIKATYFIGIGGIGMSALARYFNKTGILTEGYDRTQSKITDELIKEGINIHFEDNIDLISAKHKQYKKEDYEKTFDGEQSEHADPLDGSSPGGGSTSPRKKD